MSGSIGIFKSSGMGGISGFDISALSEIITAFGWNKKTIFELVLSLEPVIVETLKSKAE